MLTASFMIPSPNKMEFNLGYRLSFTKERAATVSVADRIQDNIRISVILSLVGMIYGISLKKPAKQAIIVKVIIVPTIPKNMIYPKFSKKSFFRRLYPAAKIIGGRMKLKKISSLNWIVAFEVYYYKERYIRFYKGGGGTQFIMTAVRRPITIATADSWRYMN